MDKFNLCERTSFSLVTTTRIHFDTLSHTSKTEALIFCSSFEVETEFLFNFQFEGTHIVIVTSYSDTLMTIENKMYFLICLAWLLEFHHTQP